MQNDLDGVIHIGWAREDRAHDTLVKTLARHVVVEGASWPIAESLEHMWRWAGPGGEAEFKIGTKLDITGPGGRPLRLHGKIAGQPLAPEARMVRKTLLAFEQAMPRPEIVILARDGDGRSADRRRGFNQVVEGLTWSFDVLLAMPEPESEAWFLCGFKPDSNTERVAHTEVMLELSFCPRAEPHRLTSQPNNAITDAKRVLRVLLGDDIDRRDACLEVPLGVLAKNGEHAGLAVFLDELRTHLLPHLDPGTTTSRGAPWWG